MKLPYLEPQYRYGHQFFEYASYFRELALLAEQNPDIIFEHTDHESLRFIMEDKHSSAVERTIYLEALSYGDPGVIMACPSPSLSGLIIRELGTPEQIDYFYDYIKTNNARTFFGLTEPNKGSDAGAMETDIKKGDKQDFYLSGSKCLFGNAKAGELGVVLARLGNGPLGIRAVFLTPEVLAEQSHAISRETFNIIGLKAAQIGKMSFNHCRISENNLLGEHLSAMERGMMSVIKTFNRLRTGVGAMGLGQAQAVLDYIYFHRQELNATSLQKYQEMYYEVEAARKLLMQSARSIDNDPFDTYAISLAKVNATHIIEKTMLQAFDILPMELVIEDEWLQKCFRDSCAWEFMEGTTNMQMENVYKHLQQQYLHSVESNNLNKVAEAYEA